MMAPAIKAAIPLEPYVVRVVFADGEVRDVDIEPLLDGPVFGPIRDRAMFERVDVDELGDTIRWPTGADLDPDVIYGSAPADWQPPIRITIPQRA
ncbi:MAG: DUF2442 domain-containing protein [Actinomycetota bacterium]|nr:DUF2442 domain-containing protein [Actinomycetota bacterium]